jgi:serine/threonine protein phosphatase PrpC
MTDSVSESSASFVQSVRSVVKSDRGLVLETNEDAFSIIRSSESRGFFVADGMGGPSKGEIASHLALSTLESLLRSKKQFLESDVRTAIEKANEAIVELAESGPHFWGMGTTVSGIVFSEDTAFIAHVGNSRIYRLRNRKLTQLTKDQYRENIHQIQSIEDGGISKVLGESKNLAIDLFEISEPPKDGDRYLCCTDGVYNAVALDELCDILEGAPLEDTAKEIIALVRGRGGKDNITALVVQIGEKAARLVESNVFVESTSKDDSVIIEESVPVQAEEIEVTHLIENPEEQLPDQLSDNFEKGEKFSISELSDVSKKEINEEDSVVGDLQNVEAFSEIDEIEKNIKKKKKGKKLSRRNNRAKLRNNAQGLKTAKRKAKQGNFTEKSGDEWFNDLSHKDSIESEDFDTNSSVHHDTATAHRDRVSDSELNRDGSYLGIQSVAEGYEGRNLKPLRIFAALCIGFLIGVVIQIGIKLLKPQESADSSVAVNSSGEIAKNEADKIESIQSVKNNNDDEQTYHSAAEKVSQDGSLDEEKDIFAGGNIPVANEVSKSQEAKNLPRRVIVLRTETIEEIQAGAQQSLVESLKQRDLGGTALDSVQLVSSIDRLNNPRVRRIMVEVVGAIEESVNETDRRLMALAEQQDKTNHLLIELIKKLSGQKILKVSDGLSNKERADK